MNLLDVNVVLAAHRDDHPEFGVARPWLERSLAEGEPFAVCDTVAVGFLRVVTGRRVFAVPTPPEDAFAYLRALRAHPAHVTAAPGLRHLEILEGLVRDADAAGEHVPDAHLAAIALEHAGAVVSFDRDFARYDQVRWTLPA